MEGLRETDVKLVALAATDEVLVAAAKLGDHSAFLELWTRHSSRAFKTTRRITGNRHIHSGVYGSTIFPRKTS